MEHQTQTQTQKPDIPKWSALLVEAVNKPGLIMKAYSAFWPYSVGNQILAYSMPIARHTARANQYVSEVADVRPSRQTRRKGFDALHAINPQAPRR